MRILLITDYFPPEINAGANRCIAHARRWAEQGHDVVVITSFPNFPEGRVYEGYQQKLYEWENMDGVNVLRVPTVIFPNSGRILRLIDFVSFTVSSSIASLLIRRSEVVVATSPHFFVAIAGYVAAALGRRPFILEVRDLWPDSVTAVGAMRDGLLVRMARQAERFLYQRANGIIAVSDAYPPHMVKHGADPAKITVVHNGVDLARISPNAGEVVRRRLCIKDRLVVSYIGTLGMAQGLEIVVSAAELLQSEMPDIVFLMVGVGAERKALENQARRRQLTNIIFTGHVSAEEVGSYWCASDIALIVLKDQPLFRTVVPSKVFEALATGTPIITNIKGELSRLLRPYNAMIEVEPANARSLANAIVELAENPDRRAKLREAGIRAAKDFDRRKQADRALNAISKALRGHAYKRPAGT